MDWSWEQPLATGQSGPALKGALGCGAPSGSRASCPPLSCPHNLYGQAGVEGWGPLVGILLGFGRCQRGKVTPPMELTKVASCSAP